MPLLTQNRLFYGEMKDGEMAEKLPTIIDNRGDNTLLHALQRLLPGVQGLDITTGLFEIGSFLLLEQLWQGLDKIRILMGDETTRRTKKEIVESLRKKSDASIEGEKERDDALTGLATGSGKTVVMAMLIAWQVINKLANKNQCVR